MTKLAMLFSGLFLGSSAFAANLVDCRTVKVIDSGYFEEALSTSEYPEMYVKKNGTQYEVHIGMNLPWKTKDGAKISHTYVEDALVVRFQGKYDESKYQLKVYTNGAGKKRGELSTTEDGRTHLIAVAYCN